MNETSQSDTIVKLIQDMLNNSSSSTAETNTIEGDNNSNIRSIDLSTSAMSRFDNRYDMGKEIEPFCDAIPDLHE